MDKYYIGKGTINGRPVNTGHTLANFRGTVEEAGQVISATNPGIENLELTENGDSETGHIVMPIAPSRTEDFAPAMMAKPRTVKVAAPVAVSADPQGRPFNPAAGIPNESVPAGQVGSIK